MLTIKTTVYVRRVLHLVILGLICFVSIQAQQPPVYRPSTSGWTPMAEQPGAPAGSYALSGFDNINLFNGHMNFRLPLMQIGGRGRAGYTMMLPFEQQWQIQTVPVPTCNQSGCTYYESDIRYPVNPEGWGGAVAGFLPVGVGGRQSGSDASTAEGCSLPFFTKTLTRLTVATADGTEFELRDVLNNGQPMSGGGCHGGPSRGKVFVTADGSAATFISDTEIFDERQATGVTYVFKPTGYLLLRDGTRYRIENGAPKWIQDSNGNEVTFSNPPELGGNVTAIDDSLGRRVTIGPDGTTIVITFKGANGAQRTIKIYYSPLSDTLRKHPDGSVEYTIKTFAQLFFLPNPQQGTFNPSVISAVELPDGRQYQFRYDSYKNLAQVILPTGGRMEYDWSTSTYQFGDHVYGVYSRVLQRRTASDATTATYDSKTTYTISSVYSGSGPVTAVVDDLDPKNGDQLKSRTKHYFKGHNLEAGGGKATDYSPWEQGHEYQTEFYASDGTTVLKRINRSWQQKANISWWNGTADDSPPNDPRLVETTTTLVDTNQVSKQTAISPVDQSVGFDQYNNQTDIWEYDYGTGAAGSLLRHTHTNFLTSSYDTLNPTWQTVNVNSTIHLRSLPTDTAVYDAGGTKRGKTVFEYDNYTLESADCSSTNHCPLLSRSNVSGFNSSWTTTQRGNLTATTKSLLVNGSETGSISAYSHYDILGNVLRTKDARGYVTQLFYEDSFGSADAEARTSTNPTELGSTTKTFGFITKAINPLAHTTYSQFDYYLGKPVDEEDANGVTFSGYYDDPLDRPTKVINASNQATSVKTQTVFIYNDTNHTITTTSDLNSFNDSNPMKSQILYDNFGRTAEVRNFENATNYITAKTEYDALGRAYRTSNPYRSGETVIWTTSTFDALSRVLNVTTPDSAVMATAYNGNRVLVTDQTGKQRISKTNALDQLTDLWEVRSADGATESISFPNHSEVTAGYRTSYSYDVLDDLIGVAQGSQTRTFVYDSLKRLLSATNPESGRICYGTVTLAGVCQADGYDNNGNLLYRTDARGVQTTYAYDVLNRNTTVTYSDGTPDTLRLYDSAGNGKGRFYATYTGTGGSNKLTLKATDSYDALGRPLNFRQHFWTGSAYDGGYYTWRTYDFAGHVKTQQYPSGRTVTYNYDQAGRLSSFLGYLGDGINRTYSSGISYTSAGALQQEQFGTDTAVYNKLFYNSRGQLSEIRESTVPNDTSWNRGAIVNHYSDLCWGMCGGPNSTTSMTDNNGNLKKQEVYVPDNEAITSYVVYSSVHTYDALNRLQTSSGVRWASGPNTLTEYWAQTNAYDRYGNRRIDTNVSNTYGTGVNNKDFTVNTANNRLGVPAGQSGTMSYDAAGNVTTDTYTGAGNRTYDAENRIVQAAGNGTPSQTESYKYSADGQRVKRNVDGVETWQVYGMDEELVAEYAPAGATTSPQKEYGYRNGQLLITAEKPNEPRTNFALSANGSTATASSTNSGYSAAAAIDGEHKGLNWTSGGGWHGSSATFPQWLQIDFNGSKTINEVDVYSVQDSYASPVEPTEAMTFSLYGMTGFDVQYWNGSSWSTVTGGSISGNNKVWRKVAFSNITTSKVRVLMNASIDSWSRIPEVEAWGPSGQPTNVALASNGATASASSTNSGFSAAAAIDGEHKGLNWTSGGGWHSSSGTFPQWLQVDFNGSKSISEIDVFSVQDNYSSPSEPTEAMTFSLYGLTGFDVQYWNGSSWVTVPGGGVAGNNKVRRRIIFSPINTSKIRVLTNASVDGWSRIPEVEAWTAPPDGPPTNIQWLVADQLGTPRMIFDKSGTFSSVKRHDYLPFGEEISAFGGRTTGQGYNVPDGLRQQFTSKEQDLETGLDYFLARYYSYIQGRFTSSDELTGGPHDLSYFKDTPVNPTFFAELAAPQSLNKYQYCYNNPLRFLDPNGHQAEELAERILTSPTGQQVINAVGGAATVTIVAVSGAGKKVWDWLSTEHPDFKVDSFCTVGDCGPYYANRYLNQNNNAPKEVVIDGSKYPESAQHAADAQKAGQPDTLTVDRTGAKQNRRDATSGTPKTSGKDRDEYPPAVTQEGGNGASVRPITPGDNRGAGASIGNQIKDVPNGGKIKIKPIIPGVFKF
jgi:RHS repeat-associated protein